MLIPSRAWGFIRAGLNGRFGVTVPNFGTGGTEDNPLLNDVDAGDEAAGVEFCPVFAAQEASGTLTVRTDGSLSFVGADDGTYVIPYALYTFTPGDAAAVDEGDADVTVSVGAATSAFDLSVSTLALTGALSASGDLAYELPINLTADPISIAGALSASGDLSISTAIKLDVSASALSVAGSLSASGDITITPAIVLDLDASPISIGGAVDVTGDLEFGEGFDLAADPIIVGGSLAVSGDLAYSVSDPTEVEPGISQVEAMRLILAALSGPTDGAGTNTEVFYSPDRVKPRITVTYDGAGNRQTVVLDYSP